MYVPNWCWCCCRFSEICCWKRSCRACLTCTMSCRGRRAWRASSLWLRPRSPPSKPTVSPNWPRSAVQSMPTTYHSLVFFVPRSTNEINQSCVTRKACGDSRSLKPVQTAAETLCLIILHNPECPSPFDRGSLEPNGALTEGSQAPHSLCVEASIIDRPVNCRSVSWLFLHACCRNWSCCKMNRSCLDVWCKNININVLQSSVVVLCRKEIRRTHNEKTRWHVE